MPALISRRKRCAASTDPPCSSTWTSRNEYFALKARAIASSIFPDRKVTARILPSFLALATTSSCVGAKVYPLLSASCLALSNAGLAASLYPAKAVSQKPSATAKFLEIIFIRALPPNVLDPARYKTSNTIILVRKTLYPRSEALEEMVFPDLREIRVRARVRRLFVRGYREVAGNMNRAPSVQ